MPDSWLAVRWWSLCWRLSRMHATTIEITINPTHSHGALIVLSCCQWLLFSVSSMYAMLWCGACQLFVGKRFQHLPQRRMFVMHCDVLVRIGGSASKRRRNRHIRKNEGLLYWNSSRRSNATFSGLPPVSPGFSPWPENFEPLYTWQKDFLMLPRSWPGPGLRF